MAGEQPAPIGHKKSVMLRFADLEVCLQSEDSYDLSALNDLAMQDLSIMIKDRVAYSSIFDADQGDSGEIPDDTKPPASVIEPQKPEIRVMYQ